MKMVITKPIRKWLVTAAAFCLTMGMNAAQAVVDGVTSATNTFDLVADQTHITTPDGDSVLIWAYGIDGKPVQYPGPTLIVNEGDLVKVTLRNKLPEDASILFPGQTNVSATGGGVTPGIMGPEAIADNGQTKVTYTFRADHAGTFMYHSGSHMDLQIEMGLVGALIVRPKDHLRWAYNHPSTVFDHEYLFMLTEMNPDLHDMVDFGETDKIDTTGYKPVLWFINGRNGPDTLYQSNAPWMPNQPYGSLARAHPGETVLIRLISMGRDGHPFHTHGNNFHIIGRDGSMLTSDPLIGPDLMEEDYTLLVQPKTTYDALFSWTGDGMNWDFYGHVCPNNDPAHPDAPAAITYPVNSTYGTRDAAQPGVYVEDADSHCKPFPVSQADSIDVAFGGFYSGSPFLGAMGSLPVGEGGLNINGGMFFMWHSHTEMELNNNDIFPGGMMTMFVVEPPGVPIP